MTFAELLAPIGLGSFATDYVGCRYLHSTGRTGRFANLVSWRELNAALSSLRTHDGRVMLVKDGKPLPASSYLFTSPHGHIQYLIGSAVRKHALAGATLVVNQADELFPQIRDLAESCEQFFGIRVSANTYAAWRTTKGFDIHWDRHDTLIVQIHGRKRWMVWEPARRHPLPDDPPHTGERPSSPPSWEGVLENGSLLYMPRGWLHVAHPCDEPSLHITFGISRPSGLDLLSWALNKLRDSLVIRRDVRPWHSIAERNAWVRSMADVFTSALQGDVVGDYLEHLATQIPLRPFLHLPDDTSSTTCPHHFDDTSLLRLAHVPRLRIRQHGNSDRITFYSSGRLWKCDQLLAPALTLLHATIPTTIDAMRKVVEGRGRPLVRPFIAGLIAADVLWTEPATSVSKDARTAAQSHIADDSMHM